MASAFSFGYMLAVPFLATLTDRIDARGILLAGSALSGAATMAFGLFAHSLWSAIPLWGLAGIGFAGAYMPGLKALTDRLAPGEMSRSITFYTASYSFGVGLSFLVSQLVADHFGWRAAFFVTGLGPLAMIAVCLAMAPVRPPPSDRKLLDLRPVFRNRPALGYVFAYGSHCFELYGMRTWIVAFWTYVAAHHGSAILSPTAVSVLVTVLAMPASIFGNEAAIRCGRHRAITVVQIASATMLVLLSLSTALAPALLLVLVVVHAVTINGDSGALTSGMSQSADPAFRGATMALHSSVGFGLSAVGGWATGVALDIGGGPDSAAGWSIVFCVLAAGILTGPLILWWSRRKALPVPSV
jgi:MFS family permease